MLRELDSYSSFVIKPAHGAMGNGILVVRERDGDWFRAARRAAGSTGGALRTTRRASSRARTRWAASPTSRSPRSGSRCTPSFAAITTEGVPDVRVIVYRGVPVMSMTRLPTRRSRGRANLHQGAVGAGHRARHRARPTSRCCDGKRGRRAPRHAAGGRRPRRSRSSSACSRSRCARATRRSSATWAPTWWSTREHGPLVLELNARPGLAIQIANRAGLAPRLGRGRRARAAGHALARADRARPRDRAPRARGRARVIRRAALVARARRRVRARRRRAARRTPPAPKPPLYDFHGRRADRAHRARGARDARARRAAPQHVKRLRFRIDPQRQLLFRGDGERDDRGRARDLDPAADRREAPPTCSASTTCATRAATTRAARRRGRSSAARTWCRRRACSSTTARARAPACACGCPRAGPSRRPTRSCVRRRVPGRASAAAASSRPTGWMIAGVLGVVREEVSGVRVAIVGPRGDGRAPPGHAGAAALDAADRCARSCPSCPSGS